WRMSSDRRKAATLIDHQVPELEERWSTITELSAPHRQEDVHPAVYRLVAEEATRWSPRIDPGHVVSLNSLIHAMWALTFITLVLASAVVLDSHRTTILMRRFWAPQSA